MGLMTLLPPAATAETALRYVGALKSEPGFQTRGKLSLPHQRIWLAAPHPVFNLDLNKIGAHTKLEQVRMTGWRYLVVSKREALATVELAASSRNDTAVFCRITDGWMAASIAHAIKLVERDALVRLRHYVLGMVRVPAIQVHALWLRDAHAEDVHDLFVVLGPSPGAISSDRILASEEFLGFLNAMLRSSQKIN